ncbi:hypothetical protein [Streptomyces sp. NPDC051665]|uniref:hypothetical protein n=1 Tax=Streptomyces sp. NPDC051665 TaxID=3154647 RepID=UPI0034432B1B
MTQPSDDYLRGWRDGYGAGRDDEAADAPLREGPTDGRRQQPPPRNRMITNPGRDR